MTKPILRGDWVLLLKNEIMDEPIDIIIEVEEPVETRLLVERTPSWNDAWRKEIFSWGWSAGFNKTRLLRQILETPENIQTYAEGYFVGRFFETFFSKDKKG